MSETRQEESHPQQVLDRPAGRRPSRRRRWLVLVMGVAGLAISAAVWQALVSHERRLIETQFEADAKARIRSIERRLQRDVEVTHFLRAFYAGSEEVTPEEFRTFTEPVLNRYDDIKVLEWIPHEGNRSLPGFDLASEPVGREALTEAGKTGEVTVSGRGDLVQNSGAQDGLLVFGPIYEKGTKTDTPEQRRENLAGFVVSVVHIDEMVDYALGFFEPGGIEVRMFDDSAPPEAPAGMHHRVPLEVPGLQCRQWSVLCTPADAYLAGRSSRVPIASLLAGVVITVLLTMYVSALVGQTARVEQLVVRRAAQLQRAKESLEREVAEHRRTEEVLRNSQALYSSLVENLPVHVLRKDLAGRFTFANQSFCNLLGKPLKEILGKTDFDFYPRELAEKYRHDDRRVAETGELFEDVEENTKDGRTRYVHVMKSAVRDASGKIVGVQVIFWDVTKRKAAEMALDHERYLLHTLMDNLPDSIYFKDTESRFLRISKALANRFGLSDAAEAVGKTDFDYFTDEHAKQARADEQELMHSGQPVLDIEEKETWPDGHDTWVATSKLPLYDKQGQIIGSFGISRDITERKRAAEALKSAKDAAETASRAKSDFLAHMSHEIRTPISAIIGMTELLFDTQLDASQREYLRMVRESGESLLSVINDILDFSKIEAGKLDLDRVEFDLHESLGDTMKLLALRAHGKGLELACQVRPEVPDGLVGDPSRLRQIVVNLVGNAIKFTEQGEVVLEVRRESQSNDEVVLHFTVADTGIGIPEEKRHLIFDVFEQADTSTTRRYGGTGLGLAIASRLVGFMGGRIWVESEVDQGSTFHFTARFGLADAAAAGARPTRPAALRDTRVLVVDDNATNRRILQEMLSKWEMKPTAAAGGRHAVELLREAHRSGEPFALVLTDANMPEMDGFALAQRIKQDTELGSTVIMMLTSGDRPGDVARCEQLGVAAYLLKPIKQSELLDAIMMALGITTAEDQGTEMLTHEQRARVGPLRILLAEDSLVSQKLAVGLLENQGHTVVVANNGKEAVAALESQAFDLVLMDVQMPEMDGLEATVAIRAGEKRSGTHTPILAMTARAMKGDRERCLEAGMDEYIAKPIRARQLFDKIETVLAGSAESARPPHPRLPETEALDWSETLRTVKGDHELLKAVVEAFLDEAPRLITAIRQAIAGGDAAGLRIAGHTLKSSLRYFGANRAFEHAYQLERIGRDGNLENAGPALTALEGAMAQITPVLLEYLRTNHLADGS